MPYFYLDPTMLLLIPGILISLWAQAKVNSTFKKYARVSSQRGFTAYNAARSILDANQLNNVPIIHVSGNLTDHYDPRARKLALSDATFQSGSLAAIGVAAHEAGHAIQHARHYSPLILRNTIYPVVNIGSSLSWPLLLLGIILGFKPLLTLGIALFSLVVIFQLITLPVEFNASRRAVDILSSSGILMQEEIPAVKKVLSAAALTYVAATLTAVLQLLRLVILFGNRNSRD